MTNKTIVTLIFFFGFLISCNKNIVPEAPEVIFEKYKSSVVLIASEYYYEIATETAVCYYSPGTERKIFFSKEDVLNNLSFSTGTGFVISENGEIITNNHVVNHKAENFKSELVNFYSEANSKIYYDIRIYSDSINQVNSTLEQFSNQLEYFEREELLTKNNEYREKKNFLIDMYKSIENLNFDNSISKLVIHRLGIAYNNTHVSDFNDLQECVVVKTSENEKIDLALIQTKNKSFNTKPNFIFNFDDNNPNITENSEKYKERNIKNPIKVNEDVFMIGFNRGFSLANTKQGIKSQFTSGKISQENDGERILYTIPTLEGSSGSPIVDKWGNLVGVNFAKVTNSQSFSFGVPVYEVKKFYEE
jgi:S1-C subfamily serine protease